MTDRQILKLIGGNVKAARLRSGFTQESLAELVGVHWQTVNYIEHGKFPFSIVTFARLSQMLETSPNRLLDGLPDGDKTLIAGMKRLVLRKKRDKAKRFC